MSIRKPAPRNLRLLIFPALLAVMLLAWATLHAQEEPVKPDTPTDIERMERAVAELEEQILREQENFTAGKLDKLREIERLRAQRDGYAISIDSLQDDISDAAQSNASNRTGIEEITAQVAIEKKLLEEITAFTTAAAPELEELIISGIPGADTAALQKEAAALGEPAEGTAKTPVKRAERFFDLGGRLLKRACAVEFHKGETLVTSGGFEDVRFLRVGELTSIYLTGDGREAGILLRSPVDESGRRYERNLPGSTVSAIRKVFSKGAAKDTPTPVPLDMSQGMLVGVSYGERGLVAYLARGGPVMIPLLVVALLALALILERLFALRRESRGTSRFAGEIADTYRDKGLQSALALAKGGRGAAARVMRAGLEKAGASTDIFEESLHEAALAELPRLERHLPSIAVLATVAPLLGLLGTVTGMISAFDTITAYGTSDPRLLSGGISEALLTTTVGLIIAIPVLLVHGFLSAKVDRITADMEQASSRLIAAVMEGAGERELAGEKTDA